uniref:Uncharacterized protein n=1 Tax=Plectus sambesii TaxID=2011161 RepID=A0A914WQS1_9BILA
MFPPHGLYFDREFGERSALGESTTKMAFTFAAFCYLLALILVAFCIFFAIFSIISIDELKTDYKNPIEQCNSLNP